MKKWILVCFSVIFLFFAMIPTAYADLSMFQPTTATKNYSDIAADAWYAASIQQCTAMGLLEGYEDGKFYPQRSISLAEATAIAVRIYETYHQETSESTIAANAESTESDADAEVIDEFEDCLLYTS